MEIQKKKCPRCGNLNYILPSNNPLVEGRCISCVNEALDVSKVEHFAFFCRTYNLPFDLNLYMTLYKKHKNKTFMAYVEALLDDGTLSFADKVTDVWPEVEKEWSKVQTYTDILLKLPEIKDSFQERARIKWGHDYTFQELVQLENLLTNTIKVYNISDPMRLDAIRKACKLSVKIDALIESGEAKVLKDYTTAYNQFLKSAQIDELGSVANENSIKTVADLYKYMEKNGFEFKFYDKEERDIVDKTLNDIKHSIREQIVNATGLDLKIQEITKSFKDKMEDNLTEHTILSSPLDDMVNEDYYEEVELETDNKLLDEELDFDYLDDDLGR